MIKDDIYSERDRDIYLYCANILRNRNIFHVIYDDIDTFTQ